MLKKYIDKIELSNVDLKKQAEYKWSRLAKPLYGMGILEDYIIKLAGINSELNFSKRCVAVVCADNGIVEENVTQSKSEVTAVVANNMTKGNATISHMSKIAKADIFVYDIGMNTDVPSVINKKVRYGTKNFAKQPALTKEEVVKGIEKGIEIVKELKNKGYNIIATGEMGIGNTSTSSAITAVLFNVNATVVTGKGAGLSKEGVDHKSNVINNAIKLLNPNKNDMIDVLSKVGGLDICAMTGIFLGGSMYKVPIIIDGFISSVSALIATELCPYTKDYMFASHASAEPAAKMILEKLQLNPPMNCKMALGEGTGAVTLLPLIDSAVEVYKNMITFDQTYIGEYKPL